MKQLADGSEVSARSYYYLLDWNDRNESKMIYSMFHKMKLHDLNKTQYAMLFDVATQAELKILNQ